MKRIPITAAMLLVGGFIQTDASMADEYRTIPDIKDSLTGGETVFHCTKGNPIAPDTFKYAKNIIGSESLYIRKGSKWVEVEEANSSGQYISLPLHEPIYGQMIKDKVQYDGNDIQVVKGIDGNEYSASDIVKRLSQDAIVLEGEVEYSFNVEDMSYTKKNVERISFLVKVTEEKYLNAEQNVGYTPRVPVNESLIEARKNFIEKGKAYKSLPWKFTVPEMGSVESNHPEYVKAKKEYDAASLEYKKQKRAQEEKVRLNEEKLVENKALARQKYFTDGYDKLDVGLMLPADTIFYSGKCMYVQDK